MQKTIEAKLAEYKDPFTQKNLAFLKAIKAVAVEQGAVKIHIEMPYPCDLFKESLAASMHHHLQEIVANSDNPIKEIHFEISQKIVPHNGLQGIPGLRNIKNIVVVASGKGGVGKSTVALNLALALQQEGAAVGILDADIYGPSLPTLLGNLGAKPAVEGKVLQPIIKYGLQTMSIGYLVEKTVAIAWRGPMLGKAMEQMINDTNWQNLDYLIVDLPPGTGDVQLSLCQKIPVTGAVMVTTPQELALSDVRRACEMFVKLKIPILGLVENMSSHTCSNCGHQEAIFGSGGGTLLAQEYDLEVLGNIPLNREISVQADAGIPNLGTKLTSAIINESSSLQTFFKIARKISAKIALQRKDFSGRFPKVVVKHEKS